ncbi:MAG: sugar ABC transporter ATP-binding protein [Christensenella sp.]|nr:sugar ABC transporter ATP-binding protein [Christensenella sp.]
MSDYVLRVDHISKHFGGVKALQDVSLDIKKGEIHCLAGENGCGKSTLIKAVSGFHAMDGGAIEIDGVRYDKITPEQAIEAGIQVIYQDFSIFPNLTAMENLSLNMELANKRKWISKKRMEKIAKEAVSKINFDVDLNETVENLSVADKQLIAISRALLNNAKLIIMDEPTTALTGKEVKALFKIIKDLQSQGIAILFVSHKLDEVFEISERFTILRSGKNVVTGETKDLDDKKFRKYMTGRDFDDVGKFVPKCQDTVLEVKNLTLKNGYQDVSFSLKQGEIVGLTGLLGSGRTELAETLFGYRNADSGEILISGKKVKIKSVEDGVANGIGYVPEDRLTEGLFLIQSINDNLAVSKWSSYANKFGIVDKQASRNAVNDAIENFRVKVGSIDDPIQTLSGGNQQKILLARWLALDLKVLILNGPTVGVDIGAKYDIHTIIRELAQKGLAVIIISDDLPELSENCNRVLIMNGGRITGETETIDTVNLYSPQAMME